MVHGRLKTLKTEVTLTKKTRQNLVTDAPMGHLLGTAHLLGDWMLIGSKLEQTSSESADSTFSIFQQNLELKKNQNFINQNIYSSVI